jgi:hypothetical protein
LKQKIISVIKIIIGRYFHIEENWAFTGSLNHYLQGIDILPNDIDIITTQQGVLCMSNCLVEFCIEKPQYKESKNLRSYFGVFKINDKRIEVMAELENKIEELWIKHSDWENNIIWVQLENIKIPCLKLEYELNIYQRLGLMERSILIEKQIKNRAN